jgi:hypothetical protein
MFGQMLFTKNAFGRKNVKEAVSSLEAPKKNEFFNLLANYGKLLTLENSQLGTQWHVREGKEKENRETSGQISKSKERLADALSKLTPAQRRDLDDDLCQMYSIALIAQNSLRGESKFVKISLLKAKIDEAMGTNQRSG